MMKKYFYFLCITILPLCGVWAEPRKHHAHGTGDCIHHQLNHDCGGRLPPLHRIDRAQYREHFPGGCREENLV